LFRVTGGNDGKYKEKFLTAVEKVKATCHDQGAKPATDRSVGEYAYSAVGIAFGLGLLIWGDDGDQAVQNFLQDGKFVIRICFYSKLEYGKNEFRNSVESAVRSLKRVRRRPFCATRTHFVNELYASLIQNGPLGS